MKRNLIILALAMVLSVGAADSLFAQDNIKAPELLGRPTDNSVMVNVVGNVDLEVFAEYGPTTGTYTYQTSTITRPADEPIELVMDGLQANTRYYYRIVYREVGTSTWIERDEHSFMTQRAPGSTFTFTIISDSHLGQYGGQTADERALYTRTMQNVWEDDPDLHLDLGDTFAMDPSPLGTGMTVAEADNAYYIQRPIEEMGLISHSIPIFLVIGNHENEEGWNFDDVFDPPDQSLAIVGLQARKKYFPNPIPDAFYSGNSDPLPPEIGPIGGDSYREDYFAWEWGDALFVVIEPYHYTSIWPSEGGGYGGEGQDGEVGGDRWDWTLGIDQFLWLKQTLENSNAKFKFVFSHHIVGGNNPYGRGGIIAAPYYEWGGLNPDDTWGWDTHRKNVDSRWGDVPIHDLLVANGVQIYFHGHDHEYVYETLDDIVYLECPKPDDAGYTWEPYSYGHNEGHYPNGLEIENSGHIRVQVSPDQVDVAYVRAYLPGDGTNQTIAHSFTIEAPYTGPTHDLTMAVDPAEGGTTVPSVGDHTYAENSEIAITANPAYGYVFDHWSGDVANSGEATTTVTMTESKTVTAHFSLAPTYDLSINVYPPGGGTTDPAAGDHSYPENTIVTINATPLSGYAFDFWEGDVADVNSATTTIMMDGNKSLTAHFVETMAGEINYMGSIGSTTSKSSGTSLEITTTAAVEAGDAIIIGCATDPNASLTIDVSDAAGNTYEEAALSVCYAHVRTYIFAAYNVQALPAGSTITLTLSTSITAKAAVAGAFRGLAEESPLDLSLGNPVNGEEQSASGTTPTVGPTGGSAQANELIIGVIGTEGPVEDAAGSWDYSFLSGPRAGTTGDDDETNMTVCLGYRIAFEISDFTAQKSGITDRYWGSTIASFKGGLSEPIAVDLMLCSAFRMDDERVAVEWSTASEVKTAGFFVHGSDTRESGYVRLHNQLIKARGNSAGVASYRFVDTNASERRRYYRLEEVSLDGTSTYYRPVPVSKTSSVESEGRMPYIFSLQQNYPNPFNPQTQIDYSIPRDGQVTLNVYDVNGRLVKQLVREEQKAGYYSVTWNGMDEAGRQVVSGTFLYRLQAGDRTATGKMVLLK